MSEVHVMDGWRRFLRDNPLYAALFMAVFMSLTALFISGTPVLFTFPFAFLVFGVQYQRARSGASQRPVLVALALLVLAMLVVLAIKSYPH
jgi:hypothetical protein